VRGDWAIFCHAGSGQVGTVWSAREKLLEILRRGWELHPGHSEDRQWATPLSYHEWPYRYHETWFELTKFSSYPSFTVDDAKWIFSSSWTTFDPSAFLSIEIEEFFSKRASLRFQPLFELGSFHGNPICVQYHQISPMSGLFLNIVECSENSSDTVWSTQGIYGMRTLREARVIKVLPSQWKWEIPDILPEKGSNAFQIHNIDTRDVAKKFPSWPGKINKIGIS